MGLHTLTSKHQHLNRAEKLNRVMNLTTVKELNKGEDRIRLFYVEKLLHIRTYFRTIENRNINEIQL
jgi:hypothetical protein